MARDLELEIVHAASSGDVQKLIGLREAGRYFRVASYEALQCAAQNGHEGTVEELLHNFSSLQYCWCFVPLKYEGKDQKEGFWYFYGAKMMASPLHLAVREGHLEVVQHIRHFFHYANVLEYVPTNVREAADKIENLKIWFECLVEWAVRWGHARILRLLLTPPFLLPTSQQESFKIFLPVHLAGHYKHFDALKLLLELAETRSSPNLCVRWSSKDKLTALHLAAQSGSERIVEFLLNYEIEISGTNVDIVNERSHQEYFTALHMAANAGHVEVVTLLLQSLKVDVLAKDRMGRTALHYAAREGHHHVVQLFLDCTRQGSIAGVPDHDGLLPLHMAARAGHVKVIRMLIRHAGCIDSVARHRLKMRSCFDIVFIDNPRFRVYKGSVTEFYYNYSKFNIDKVYTENFPRPNLIDSLFWKTEGFTPLHFAARYGHEAAVRELIGENSRQMKPNLYLKDHAGFLAFDWMEVQKKGKLFLAYARVSQGKVVVDALRQASCLRKMTKRMQSTVAEDIEEEKEAMGEAQHAWESCTTPRFTMRVLQWLMEPDEEWIQYLMPRKGVTGRDMDDVTRALMMALRKGRFWLAKEIVLLLEPTVVLDNCVGEMLKQMMMEVDMPMLGPNKHWIEFVIALVKNDKLSAGASNLLRWMLQWALKMKESELVEVILDRPDLKKALYEDRQVYLDCANAILVGATLIGGVAFQAWLQPPLGYNYTYEGGEYANVHNRAMRMFWRFNNAAFFFSMATLIVGLKGAVPVAHQTEIVESLEKVKTVVAVASSLLAVALVCVVVAFIEAGFAVLPPIHSDLEIMHTSAAWGSIVFSLASLWFIASVWRLAVSIFTPRFRALRETITYYRSDNEGFPFTGFTLFKTF